MATWRLLALLWVMPSSSDTAQTGPSAGFEATPQWIQKTYERAMSISRTDYLLSALPKAKHAWKPVQGEAIDKVRARVGSSPQDAQGRVADRYSPCILRDATANLERYVMYVEGRPNLLLGLNPLLVRLRSRMVLILNTIELTRHQWNTPCVSCACNMCGVCAEVDPAFARDGFASGVRAVPGEQVLSRACLGSLGAKRSSRACV